MPDGVPAPHAELSACDTFYDYCDQDGRPLFYIRRNEARGSKRKEFLPLTYGVLGGREGWHTRAAPPPRPLYGLDRLAERPDAAVIISEGEKSTNAAAALFPDHVCVSWPGGANAVAQADWSPLQGREVIVWPDADEAGSKAAKAILARLPRARVLRVDDLANGADAADVNPPDPEAWLRERLLPAAAAENDTQPWRTINVAGLQGVPVPVRRWIIPQWLPVRVVTLNYADGGVGKTLLGLQLMAATALGMPWCGLDITPCKSVGLFSEDDADEIHIRLEAIRQHYNVSWADMHDMCPVDATGQDNTLIRFERDGAMVLTPRFRRLREQALDIGARLVVIDTAATTFGGNENDRAQVTAFVGSALTSLAQDIDGAVLLNAHPSLSGISSGDLRSGSTGWNNSCRSRWALARPVNDETGKPILDSPDRVLTRWKANAAATGDTISLRWQEGVFRTPQGMGNAAGGSRKDAAEGAFLAALRAQSAEGLHVSQNAKAGNYAPKTLAMTPECRDFRGSELKEAMTNLLKRGTIRTALYKHDSKTREELVEAT